MRQALEVAQQGLRQSPILAQNETTLNRLAFVKKWGFFPLRKASACVVILVDYIEKPWMVGDRSFPIPVVRAMDPAGAAFSIRLLHSPRQCSPR